MIIIVTKIDLGNRIRPPDPSSAGHEIVSVETIEDALALLSSTVHEEPPVVTFVPDLEYLDYLLTEITNNPNKIIILLFGRESENLKSLIRCARKSNGKMPIIDFM